MSEVNEKPTEKELIERYAEINGLTFEQAQEEINAPSYEEILKNIENKTLERIRSKMPVLNRAQRRALAKKSKGKAAIADASTEAIAETTKKLNYIRLIEGLRKLNEKEENKNYEDTIKAD